MRQTLANDPEWRARRGYPGWSVRTSSQSVVTERGSGRLVPRLRPTCSCLRSPFYLVERAAGGVLSRTGLAWAPGVERAGRASPPLHRPPSTWTSDLLPLFSLSCSLSPWRPTGFVRRMPSRERRTPRLTCLSAFPSLPSPTSPPPPPISVSSDRETAPPRNGG